MRSSWRKFFLRMNSISSPFAWASASALARICSLKAAPAKRRSRNQTFSDRARLSARRWTTSPTRRRRPRSSSASRVSRSSTAACWSLQLRCRSSTAASSPSARCATCRPASPSPRSRASPTPIPSASTASSSAPFAAARPPGAQLPPNPKSLSF